MTDRGRQPIFTDEPMLDRLYSISLALIAELAATRARVDTLERVLAKRELITADAIDRHEFSAEDEQARAQMHQRYLQRLFRQSASSVEEGEMHFGAAPNPSTGALTPADLEDGTDRCPEADRT
jgi:hypothetical protein